MFNRTPSGIRNIHLFYSNCYLVIVEGTQDQPFWSKFFPEEINGYKRKFKPVGGKPEVQKHINELVSTPTKFAIAMDSDYRLLVGSLHNHKRIVETEYYSIENLMLYSLNITTLIRDLSHDTDYEYSKVDTWLEQFDETVYSLMVADVLIEQNNLGYSCVGDNCSRFLTANKHEFDPGKIKDAIKKLNIPQEDLDITTQKLRAYKPRFHIRGHFFFNAVRLFTTLEVKRQRKVSISEDSFYTMAMNSFESCFLSNPLLKNIRERAETAAQEVVRLLEKT